MRGAGGTDGGVGQFFLGFVMLCSGLYLLLNAISVTSSFGFGMPLYGMSVFGIQYALTSGMVLFPFLIGIAMIFFNGRSLLGWLLALGALVALIAGVIASLHFNLRTMTAFDLITILILTVGGLGLFLRSLKSASPL
jgi:hypothetical protein